MVIMGLVVQTYDYDCVPPVYLSHGSLVHLLFIFLLLALVIFMLLSIFSIKDHIEENVM